MRRRLTASGIALARCCAWWARPDVDVPEADSSAAADVGTALHAVAENESDAVDELAVDAAFADMVGGVGAGVGPSSTLRPADRAAFDALAASWRAWWPDFARDLSRVATEVPFALNLETGGARELPSDGQRDYSAATPTEIPGTADLVAWRGDELIVLDYKTGQGPHRYVDHEDQMRFLGACAALACGVSRVRVIVAHVAADGVNLDERVLDSLEIAMLVYELRALAAQIVDAVARPGLHCEEMWCAAKAVCPATRAVLVAAEVPLELRRRVPIVGPMNDNDATFATLVACDLLEAWIADRRKVAKAYADRSPVRSPDGRVYRAREVEREEPRIDVDGAEAALARALGEEGARRAIVTTRKTSWKAIGDVARARKAAGEKLTIKDVEEHARAELRGVGALKVSKFTQYGWKKEKESQHG